MSNQTKTGQEFWLYASLLAIATGLFIVFMSLVFLLFAGNISRLKCQLASGQQVDCSLQNSWFGIFKIEEQAIQDIRQVDIGEHCDEDGDCTYRLELISGESIRIPLTPFYSAGRDEKLLAQQQISKFLKHPEANELAIRISGSSGQMASVLLSIIAGIGGSGLMAFGIKIRRKNDQKAVAKIG